MLKVNHQFIDWKRIMRVVKYLTISVCLSLCVQCWSVRSLHRVRPFKQDFMLFSKYILIVAYKVFDWCWQIKWKLPTHGHSRVRFTRQLIITFYTWCVCGAGGTQVHWKCQTSFKSIQLLMVDDAADRSNKHTILLEFHGHTLHCNV